MTRADLERFQGDLKSLPRSRYVKLRDSLLEDGFFQPIYLWHGHKLILDGHQRLKVFDDEGWEIEGGAFPVVEVEAKTRKDAARLVLKMSSGYGKVETQGLLDFVRANELEPMDLDDVELPELKVDDFTTLVWGERGDVPGLPGEEGDDDDGEKDVAGLSTSFQDVRVFTEGVIFSSSNEWGLPDLLPDMLCDSIPMGVWSAKGEIDTDGLIFIHSKTKQRSFLPEMAQSGYLAFYEDDSKFQEVWQNAVVVVEAMVDLGWKGVVAPDFSMWRGSPRAVQLFEMFKSRWCARYWQEAGVRVIPSLNWSDETTYKWTFKGMPVGAPVVSAQCRTTRGMAGKHMFCKGINVAIQELQPQNVLLYGGDEHRKWLEPMLQKGPTYHWLQSWMSLRRPKAKAKDE